MHALAEIDQTSADLVGPDGVSRGFWLRTPAVEVFVAIRPVFRLLALRVPGGASLMADHHVCEQGLRLAFLEPEQVPASFEVGNRAAELIDRDSAGARLRLAPAAGLRYSVDLALAIDRPRLRVDLALENLDAVPRGIACWSVLSFARGEGGVIVAPFSSAVNSRRRLVLPSWSAWPQPGVAFGRNALLADTGRPLNGAAYKVGLISDAGWIAFARGRSAIVARTPFDPATVYPEDGANITFFEGDDGRSVWCEIEQVGPLMPVPPGEVARLTQIVELVELDDLPNVGPDILRDTLAAKSGTRK